MSESVNRSWAPALIGAYRKKNGRGADLEVLARELESLADEVRSCARREADGPLAAPFAGFAPMLTPPPSLNAEGF